MAIKAVVIVNDDFNYCRHTKSDFYFCKYYYNMIVKKKISKFRFTNYINILPYQKYPNALSDFTLVKKTFIAYTHFAMFIIKLRPGKTDSTTLYYQIQGYMVVLLQNLRPLFTILFSSNLTPHNVICIVYASKHSYIPFDIYFLGRI